MKRFQFGFISFTILFGMLAVSCNNESSGITQHADIGKFGVNPQVSDCGGFSAASKTLSSQQMQNDQCRDERLLWQYDPNSRMVTFLNEDVWLNCCGEHSITITLHETTGNYIIRETDAPAESRCLCMCFFDFTIGLPDMLPESIGVELYRHVTDDGPEWLVWQGTLELNQGSGEIVIQKNIGWCQ